MRRRFFDVAQIRDKEESHSKDKRALQLKLKLSRQIWLLKQKHSGRHGLEPQEAELFYFKERACIKLWYFA